MTKHLIVSRHLENTEWTRKISCVDRCFIYNKGTPLISSIPLPNINREAHTYLYHIITNYDKLADYNFFVQGNPFPHMKGITEVNLNEKIDSFICIGHNPLFSEFIIDHTGLSKACYLDCLRGNPNEIFFHRVPSGSYLKKTFYLNLLAYKLSFISIIMI